MDKANGASVAAESENGGRRGAFEPPFIHHNTIGMIPEYVKEQILNADLKGIIEHEGIELKRSSGGAYVCRCPFHEEKTPSFNVSTARNLWHCFGCGEGGDAISFIRKLKGMTYYEAVEYLAAELGIEYDKTEETPEERQARFKVSQIMDANTVAAEWFRSCLEASPGAKAYVEKRKWNDESVKLFGIGYAPRNGGLLRYMTGKGWKPQALLDAGLVKRNENTGELYDTFRERIMFPISGRTGYIAGFSGRYTGDKKEVPKYLNTSETDVFKKAKLLFGWSQACRQMAANGTATLVEGNPDVVRLQQIGVKTAVAPCGTALTDEQIGLIRSRAGSVVIIGDTDEAGVKAMLKNAELCLRAGLSVKVMTLPEGKDADEYFISHSKGYDDCLATCAHDFLPFLCRQRMAVATSQNERADVIKAIGELLSFVKDENTVQMYLDSFKKEYKAGGKIWDQEYFKAVNARERKEAKDEKAEDMLKEYGFYVKDNSYFGAGNSTNDKRWSNFIMIPILHIRDERNAKRIYLLRNRKRQEAVVKLSQSEMVSFADFRTRTETAGNYVWEASNYELTSLKKYLYDDTPSADEIRQLGWQKRHGFYAWGNGGFENGVFKKVDKYGILDIGGKKYYLPGAALDTQDNTQGYQQMRSFVYLETNDISLRDFSAMLVRVFGDNAKVALCFLVATLFKDIVTGVTTNFPILNLFGPKGSGKSELGHALTAFFVTNNKAPNINSSTKAALAEAVAEVSDAIVHLDEYKNDLDIEKREFLKGLWDGTGRSRINIDNDRKRETTAVDCGVVISGQEMPTADIALFNRLVFLTFSKTVFTDRESRDFSDLVRVEKRGLTHLTGKIIQLRGKFQAGFRSAWDDTLADMDAGFGNRQVEERTRKNWATVLSAFRCVERDLDLPFTYPEMLSICCSMCLEQNAQTLMGNELSGFWEIVGILVGSSKIWIGVDYKVLPGRRMVRIKESANPLELNPEKKYLYMAFERISLLYDKEGRASSGKTLPRNSLKYYLEHSPEFLGTVKSMRFNLIENPQGYVPASPESRKSRVTKAMVFDYERLRNAYDLDLEVSSFVSGEDDSPDSRATPPGLFADLAD